MFSSKIARDMSRDAARRQGEKGRGGMPALLHFSSQRAVDIQIPNVLRLPCTEENPEVRQNPDGTFVILEGYSAAGGEDAEPDTL